MLFVYLSSVNQRKSVQLAWRINSATYLFYKIQKNNKRTIITRRENKIRITVTPNYHDPSLPTICFHSLVSLRYNKNITETPSIKNRM